LLREVEITVEGRRAQVSAMPPTAEERLHLGNLVGYPILPALADELTNGDDSMLAG
jgi:hypothetical protein